MKIIKNMSLLIFATLLLSSKAWCADAWVNDLRNVFTSNNAIIYEINIRTFNAKDTNGNGIIEENLDEERGTFLNAIDRLDELAKVGINTVHVMPITPVGKIKALGTAGSLYAAAGFDRLNPQFKSPKSSLTLNEEFRKFVEECHNRRIRVIVDMPSCGAYDLYLNNPELFKEDKNQNPIVPADWTDVRLFDAGDDKQLNMDVYRLYQNYVDMMLNFGVDGIRADVATIKPYEFWKKLIAETKGRNPQFLFLAKASDSGEKSPSEHAVFTPLNRLLDAGFDGYYGSYSNLKDWKTAKELYDHVNANLAIAKKYSNNKSVIGNFATHDDISPILINGPQMSKMIIWLNSTLPLNAYYTDGFPSGDSYIYPLINKKADKTYTDDEYYFVHRGQMDIFNFSRRPGGRYQDVFDDFISGNRAKILATGVLTQGDFVPLKTSSPSVFAYSRNFENASLIVIGNLDFQKAQKRIIVRAPKVTPDTPSFPLKLTSIPTYLKGKITTDLVPGEIQVLFFNSTNAK